MQKCFIFKHFCKKNEIESLRDELRQSEFKSGQHRIGKEKVS